MDIKPIETFYDGYHFRSRLEARWAVFFNTLGVKYEYEKEGYDLDGRRYLPDFWLPEHKQWVEIKGQEPTEEEQDLASLLAYYTGYQVAMLWGSIGVPQENDSPWGHETEMFMFEKSHVTFYARPPVMPVGGNDTFLIDHVPLSIVKKFRPLFHRWFPLGLILDVAQRKIRIEIGPDEGEGKEEIQKAVDKLAEDDDVVNFLSIKRGWLCAFYGGRYLLTGWKDCLNCRALTLESSSGCHLCNSRRKYISYDTPRLIAAYTAARQARFEHQHYKG